MGSFEEGIVLDVQGDIAIVGIKNTNVCSHCNLCFARQGDLFLTEAQNTVGAQKGDIILLERSLKRSLIASILVFGLPIFLLISAVFISQNIFHQSQVFSFLIGFIASLIAFVPSKLYNDHLCRSYPKDAFIIKILSSQNLPE